MKLEEITSSDIIITALNQEMQSPGPWGLKASLKEKLNCYLNFKLAGVNGIAFDIRGYLCNQDNDDVWVNSMNTHVFPYLEKEVYDVKKTS